MVSSKNFFHKFQTKTDVPEWYLMNMFTVTAIVFVHSASAANESDTSNYIANADISKISLLFQQIIIL